MKMANLGLFIVVRDLKFGKRKIPARSILCLDYVDCYNRPNKKCKTRIVLKGNEVIYTDMSRGEIINLVREAENIERIKN